MTIGENIKKIRKEKGLTQKELGALCGMSESQIRHYELNYKTPRIETIRKIAKALNIYISDIVDGEWHKFSVEEIKEDLINDEEKKYYKELDKRKITLIFELLSELFKRNNKYPVNLNDFNGLNIFINNQLKEYKTLSNEELVKLENELFNYLEFILEKALENKEIIKK